MFTAFILYDIFQELLYVGFPLQLVYYILINFRKSLCKAREDDGTQPKYINVRQLSEY